MTQGFVYALRSESCPHIKIGMTTTSPFQRIIELNSSGVYMLYGKWTLLDCRKVRNCRAIEMGLHRRLAGQRVTDHGTATELFSISGSEARAALDAIPETEMIGAQPVSKLLRDVDLLVYLQALFRTSGLENFFSAQEAWTFSLFPSTNGGERFFTLNIDNHEVAFSGRRRKESLPFHNLVMDELVEHDLEVRSWMGRHSGEFYDPPYKNAFPRSVLLNFSAELDAASEFLTTGTVRRALLAYWYDYLLAKTDRGSRSMFARFHNYNAVSEIFKTMRERERFFGWALI